ADRHSQTSEELLRLSLAEFGTLLDSTPATPPAEEEQPEPPQQPDQCTLAIAMLAEKPTPKIKAIASRLGVNREALYHNSAFAKFREIAEKLGVMKSKGDPSTVRRGHKAKDGSIEAYEDEQEEDD